MAAEALRSLQPELIEKLLRYGGTADKSAPKLNQAGFKFWTKSWTGIQLSDTEVMQHFQAGLGSNEVTRNTTLDVPQIMTALRSIARSKYHHEDPDLCLLSLIVDHILPQHLPDYVQLVRPGGSTGETSYASTSSPSTTRRSSANVTHTEGPSSASAPGEASKSAQPSANGEGSGVPAGTASSGSALNAASMSSAATPYIDPVTEMKNLLIVNGLEAFYRPLRDLGCDRPSDLSVLTAADLAGIGMKVVQARKLLEAAARWRANITTDAAVMAAETAGQPSAEVTAYLRSPPKASASSNVGGVRSPASTSVVSGGIASLGSGGGSRPVTPLTTSIAAAPVPSPASASSASAPAPASATASSASTTGAGAPNTGPIEWEEYSTGDGFLYYFHTPTGNTQWLRPYNARIRTLAMRTAERAAMGALSMDAVHTRRAQAERRASLSAAAEGANKAAADAVADAAHAYASLSAARSAVSQSNPSAAAAAAATGISETRRASTSAGSHTASQPRESPQQPPAPGLLTSRSQSGSAAADLESRYPSSSAERRRNSRDHRQAWIDVLGPTTPGSGSRGLQTDGVAASAAAAVAAARRNRDAGATDGDPAGASGVKDLGMAAVLSPADKRQLQAVARANVLLEHAAMTAGLNTTIGMDTPAAFELVHGSPLRAALGAAADSADPGVVETAEKMLALQRERRRERGHQIPLSHVAAQAEMASDAATYGIAYNSYEGFLEPIPASARAVKPVLSPQYSGMSNPKQLQNGNNPPQQPRATVSQDSQQTDGAASGSAPASPDGVMSASSYADMYKAAQAVAPYSGEKSVAAPGAPGTSTGTGSRGEYLYGPGQGHSHSHQSHSRSRSSMGRGSKEDGLGTGTADGNESVHSSHTRGGGASVLSADAYSDVFERMPSMDPKTMEIIVRAGSVANPKRMGYADQRPDIRLKPLMRLGPEHSALQNQFYSPGLSGKADAIWAGSLRPNLYSPRADNGAPRSGPDITTRWGGHGGAAPSDVSAGYGYRHAASLSQAGEGGDVYDRLTDVRGFTGTHKARFDRDGRGVGIAGRDDTWVLSAARAAQAMNPRFGAPVLPSPDLVTPTHPRRA